MLDTKINMRKPNLFEYFLLVIGILAISVGYFFVHLVLIDYGLRSFEFTLVFLTWVISIILIIIAAVNENSKEELKIIIKLQHDETKLLREDLRRKR